MKKITLILFIFIVNNCYSQWNYYNKSDNNPIYFKEIQSQFQKYIKTTYNFSEIDKKSSNYKTNSKSIKNITDTLNSFCKNDLEKCRAYYIWIFNNIEFYKTDYNGDWVKSFLNRKGVCLDYSLIFQQMCKLSNIECYVIGGIVKIPNSDRTGYKEGLHAWNIFKINNEYYFTDVTWGKGFKDIYFGCNPVYFQSTHYGTKILSNLTSIYNCQSSTGTPYIIEHEIKDFYSINHDTKNYKNDKELINFKNISNFIKKWNNENYENWLNLPVYRYSEF